MKNEKKKEEKILFALKDILFIRPTYIAHQYYHSDETRYYTKGDANVQEDDGYRLKKDVVGKVKIRIPYIGYLTLWVNDALNK